MGLMTARLRRWLFQLCQSRAGQCLEQKTKSQQNL
jgi:hypothetical protein